KIFHTQLLDRVRALPGVESAALTRVTPFSYNPPSSAPIEIDGYQSAPDEQPNANIFRSARIISPLLESRLSPAASLLETMTRTPPGSRSSMKRWRQNIGREKILSASGSK